MRRGRGFIVVGWSGCGGEREWGGGMAWGFGCNALMGLVVKCSGYASRTPKVDAAIRCHVFS